MFLQWMVAVQERIAITVPLLVVKDCHNTPKLLHVLEARKTTMHTTVGINNFHLNGSWWNITILMYGDRATIDLQVKPSMLSKIAEFQQNKERY